MRSPRTVQRSACPAVRLLWYFTCSTGGEGEGGKYGWVGEVGRNRLPGAELDIAINASIVSPGPDVSVWEPEGGGDVFGVSSDGK